MTAADTADVVKVLRADLPRTLIALDFDGTLAPIVADPASSRPAPGAVAALTTLAEAGARIAVITGRDAPTALELGGFAAVPGLVIEGNYGAETWQDGELSVPNQPPEIVALRERLPAVVAQHAGDPAVWIEDKGLSLVVHARRAADPAAAIDQLRGPVGELAEQLGLDPHAGRGVLEIRIPGYDKGVALLRLVERFDPTAVLFAGDDLGDLPAFAAIRRLRAEGRTAWGLGAASAEVPELAEAADLNVDGPAGVVALLTELADGRT
jgi:trehalose 6-phosphate phosphatase